MGKNQGTFQYCKSSQSILVCVDLVAGLIGGNKILAKAKIPGEEDLLFNLEITEAGKGSRKFEALCYVESEVLENDSPIELITSVDSWVVTKQFKKEEIPINHEGRVGVLILQLGLIKTEINNLIKEAGSLKANQGVDQKVVKSLIDKLLAQEQQLDKYLSTVGKSLKISQRKDVFPQVQEIKDLVVEFYAALRDLQKGQISNDTIASLNSLAYKNITKRGLQKKLDKRALGNINMINNIYTTVDEIVSDYNFDALKEKYADLSSSLGDCVISCNSFLEALEDGDCLCLSFDVGRSEAAIVDPTQVLIKTVFPSLISAGSFLYSAQFTLKKDNKAHGGFEKHAEGLLVKGAAQENITGVMPLFICPENWKVAKLLMKPTLGWSAALDPLGYNYQQMKIIPFLVMVKLTRMAHENPGSEFLKLQLRLVKETCVQIIKDGSLPEYKDNFAKEIQKFYDNYLKDPAIRTADVIIHNPVFLCQLYCAIEAGLIEKKDAEYDQQFFQRLLEEELRRRQEPWKNEEGGSEVTSLLFKLLNVDVQKYIEEPLAEYLQERKNKSQNELTSGESANEMKFLAALHLIKPDNKEQNSTLIQNSENLNIEDKNKDKQEENKGSDMKVNPQVEKVRSIPLEFALKKNDSYNNFQQNALQEYQETLKKVMGYLDPLRTSLIPGEFDVQKFKTWGITDDVQFFCLYIQNKLQSKNSVRREAIASKFYKDPWTQAPEFIQHWYKKLVEDEKSKRITKFMSELEGLQGSEDAAAFIKAANPSEAAGAFMGANIGHKLPHFFALMIKNETPCAREKIEMMIKGYYKGVKLYVDAEGWNPCRSYGNAIWRKHKEAFSPEEWKALIPAISYRFMKGEVTKYLFFI